ncbi:MAG: 7-keto-8-aminopelargonate synthetase-like enzyme [Crocinitomix sp.]|jgi:7-keto-8-aminopelargonate synthetase-like enzyme
MSKNSLIRSVEENITHAIDSGVIHLVTGETQKSTATQINGKQVISFSSYSYLGLERREELINGCVDAVTRYGTQFGFSRAYLSLDLYSELEDLLEQIFKAHVVVAPSTTLAHQAALPVLVGDNDLILIDQYAHASIYATTKMLSARGVKFEIVRHNKMDQLEDRIKKHRQHYDQIWYLCDGVYSMHGDYAPIKKLKALLDKYSSFRLYIDDAHGISWCGTNGAGYVLNEIDPHEQMVVCASLNKAFAAAGGVLIVKNQEWKRKVRNCGGTLIFSTPIQPPMLGAGIASAKLHLKDELVQLQNKLAFNVRACREEITRQNLPEISQNNSPIFFIPCVLPKVSYQVSKLMLDQGYYLTPTAYPAVSPRKSGLRFCISADHEPDQIKAMVQQLKIAFVQSLKDNQVNPDLINKTFKIKHAFDFRLQENSDFTLLVQNSIACLDPDEWNLAFKNNPLASWSNLQMFEQIFKKNSLPEHNWTWHYFVVKDPVGQIVLATFFCECLMKDDAFKTAAISESVECLRKHDKYYLCSTALLMGTPITEGGNLYLSNSSDKALDLLVQKLSELQLKKNINAIILRDFDPAQVQLSNYFIENGFAKIEMPASTHALKLDQKKTFLEHYAALPKKKRQEIRRDAMAMENKYQVKVKEHLSEPELDHAYTLYRAVQEKSYTLNTFPLPVEFLQAINRNPEWEFLELCLNPDEYLQGEDPLPVAIVFCHKTGQIYTPLYLGLDYRYKYSHKNYKQVMLQLVKRAKVLKLELVNLGVTGATEKKRYGASTDVKKVFVQMQDSYNQDMLRNLSIDHIRN